RSPRPAGHAMFTYRVVTAGVPEGYGTEDVTFWGNNRSLSFSDHSAAAGPEPAHVYSGTERVVDGQVYVLDRIHGRPAWVHEPFRVNQNSKDRRPGGAAGGAAPRPRLPARRHRGGGGRPAEGAAPPGRGHPDPPQPAAGHVHIGAVRWVANGVGGRAGGGA